MNPGNGLEGKAKALVAYIGTLPDFRIETENLPYGHMGATITDAMLQSGLTWETTVKPRLDKVRKYPQAKTTSGFLALLKMAGINNLLDWKDSEKPGRILGVTQYFKDEGIETEPDLKNWFEKPGNDGKLLKLRGIGPKTLDYFKKLADIAGCAVDRHLREFVNKAGIAVRSDEEVKRIVDRAADLMGIDKSDFDLSIWRYMSERKRASAC